MWKAHLHLMYYVKCIVFNEIKPLRHVIVWMYVIAQQDLLCRIQLFIYKCNIGLILSWSMLQENLLLSCLFCFSSILQAWVVVWSMLLHWQSPVSILTRGVDLPLALSPQVLPLLCSWMHKFPMFTSFMHEQLGDKHLQSSNDRGPHLGTGLLTINTIWWLGIRSIFHDNALGKV